MGAVVSCVCWTLLLSSTKLSCWPYLLHRSKASSRALAHASWPSSTLSALCCALSLTALSPSVMLSSAAWPVVAARVVVVELDLLYNAEENLERLTKGQPTMAMSYDFIASLETAWDLFYLLLLLRSSALMLVYEFLCFEHICSYRHIPRRLPNKALIFAIYFECCKTQILHLRMIISIIKVRINWYPLSFWTNVRSFKTWVEVHTELDPLSSMWVCHPSVQRGWETP